MSSTDGPLPKRRKIDQPANHVDTTSTLPHLNDECLVAILQWLPLKRKIQFERVSQRWRADLIPKSFSNETSLKLHEFLPKSSKWHCWPPIWLSGWPIFKSLINRTGKHLFTLDISSRHRDDHITTTTASPFALRQIGTQLNELESLIHMNHTFALPFYDNVLFGVSSMAKLKRFSTDGIIPGTFLRSLPGSIISLKCGALASARNYLVEFLRSHAGLEQFEIDYDLVAHDNSLLFSPTLLAQYCSGLTTLRLCATGDYRQSTATAFADALRSLTQLKQLFVQLNHNFTDSVLQSLCSNCPNLEVLQMGDLKKEMMGRQWDLTVAGLMHIGALKKLKCLQMHWLKCDISDEFVSKLCGGSGATLEELKFNSDSLTDASLLQLAVGCSNLVHLDVHECRSFTEAGVKKFFEEINGQPVEQGKIRHLHLIVSAKLNFTTEYTLDLFVRQNVTVCPSWSNCSPTPS